MTTPPTTTAEKEKVMATLARVRALHESGRYSEALPLAQEAAAAASATGDRAVQFRALTALGHVLRASGDFEGALNLHGAALKLAEARQHHDDMALSWNNIGVIFQVGSAWELAIECFARVTDQAPLNTTPAAYLSRVNLALCYMHLGDEAAGLPEAEAALALEASPTCPKTVYTSLLLRHAYVQMALKCERLTPDTIRTHAAAALALGNPEGDPRCAILQALISGSLAVAYDDREAGITTLKGALALAQQAPDMMADTLACLIEAEKLAGRPGRAQQYLAEWLKHVYHDANQQALQSLGLRTLAEHQPLTAEFLQLLELLSQGMLSKQIAEEVGLTDRTVRNKLSLLYRKLGVNNSNAAVTYYLQHRSRLHDDVQGHIHSLHWYTRCLLLGHWRKARREWRLSGGVLQEEAALLPLHFALLLLGDDDALAGLPPLSPAEVPLFEHLAAWHGGNTELLPKVQELLCHADHSHRRVGLIALYKSAEKRGLSNVASSTLYTLFDRGYLTLS